MACRAVCFDVDFTLIRPGPTFRAEGYRAFADAHGVGVDPSRFERAVAGAAPLLDHGSDSRYDAEIFVAYTRRILELMGGTGDRLDECAREMYDQWASCHHFELYDDVPDALRRLSAAGIRVGLISNSHRCLESFQSHFDLRGLIAVAVSSSEHGFMKPHHSIFSAALDQLSVTAAEALMVGDSVRHDVDGALQVGMRAVLLHRRDELPADAEALSEAGVPIIRSLSELPSLVGA